jgi:hypothetical protein
MLPNFVIDYFKNGRACEDGPACAPARPRLSDGARRFR